jgi:N-acyl-D-aspartate/D-glutamate deacylase
MLDIKIVGGTIVDGTGAPGFRCDVGIKDGRIVAVGDVVEEAREEIDATGKVVAPGFVDVHTHYDAQAFWDPTFSPSCYHGVTTVLGGFCGFSIAPLTPEASPYLLRMLARVEGMPEETLRAGVPWDWNSFGEFLSRLEGRIALNAGFFVGHSAVRRVVMGERAVGSRATDAEIAEMKRLVGQSLAEGALGFSTTVSDSHNDADGNPVPSRHASREEILDLASVVGEHDGTSLEILPDVSFDQESIEFVTDYSLAGQRRVNWNLLAVTSDNADVRERAERQLSATTYARSKGAEVIALTAASPSSTFVNLYSGFIFDALPGWAPIFRLPVPERIEKLKDPTIRAILENGAATQKGLMTIFTQWADYLLAEVHAPQNKAWQGKRVGEVATALGKSPFDTMLDIAIDDGLRTPLMLKVHGEDLATYKFRAELWRSDRTVVGGSDAGAHMDMIDSFSFATKLLQKSREYGVLPLEEAVHQITQVPAEFMGIRDRGLLKQSYHADVVVFDPETVGAAKVHTRYDLPGTSTAGRLYSDAIGIEHVLVNGSVVIRNGEITEARPGTVMRSGRDTYTIKVPGVPALIN